MNDEEKYDAHAKATPHWETLSPLLKLKTLRSQNLRAPSNRKAMLFQWALLSEHLLQVEGVTAAGKSYELVCWALYGFVPIRRGGKVIFYCNKRAHILSLYEILCQQDPTETLFFCAHGDGFYRGGHRFDKVRVIVATHAMFERGAHLEAFGPWTEAAIFDEAHERE